MEKFKKLNLNENLLRALKDLHFSEPSEIQEKSIPLILEGKDVLGSSATGSGKTLAFGAGIVENVKKGKGIQALILTPTRELCMQVAESLRKFSKYYSFRIEEIYGGVAINPQINALNKADIVVGTPGRVLDHLTRRTIDFSRVGFLVLDEADRMLEMGFIEDVDKIISKCPKKRQTLLFSATISMDIEHLSKKYMNNPKFVSVESYVDPSKLDQVYYDVPTNIKFSLFVHLLKQEKSKLVMVFCNTRRNVDLIARNLKRYNLDVLAIHGGLAQNKRGKIMESFHATTTKVLICTDVAARGLDIKGVTHVYNYDIPKNSSEYIHRIGRTARAGKEGKAISLVAQNDYSNFRSVKKDESLEIKSLEVPNVENLRVDFRGNLKDDKNRGTKKYSFRGNSRSGGGNRFGGGRGGGRKNYDRKKNSGSENKSFGRREFGGGDKSRERFGGGEKRGGRFGSGDKRGGRFSGGDKNGGRFGGRDKSGGRFGGGKSFHSRDKANSNKRRDNEKGRRSFDKKRKR
jgi:superfamily II DNA/RNA helicase